MGKIVTRGPQKRGALGQIGLFSLTSLRCDPTGINPTNQLWWRVRSIEYTT